MLHCVCWGPTSGPNRCSLTISKTKEAEPSLRLYLSHPKYRLTNDTSPRVLCRSEVRDPYNFSLTLMLTMPEQLSTSRALSRPSLHTVFTYETDRNAATRAA